MRVAGRSLAAVLAFAGAVTAAAGAQPSPRCTSDVLPVDSTPVAASFCVAPATGPNVTVTESFAAGGKSFTRPLSLVVIPGTSATNAVDDVALAPLGSTKSLHLDIAYRDGQVVLEHALLLPGAIVLK